MTLYEAGNAYGASPTALATATTDADGDFTVYYSPPATPGVVRVHRLNPPEVRSLWGWGATPTPTPSPTPTPVPSPVLYLTAIGGDAGAGANSAIGLMGVAGQANALPASVTINELTTVAGEWALAQFTDTTGQLLGAPASNLNGLVNAANQAQANLADIGTGNPAEFWSDNGASVPECASSPPVNCDGLERMDTLANILAACIETSSPSSSACTTLLGDTGSTGGTTLRAAHYTAVNPTQNLAALYALQADTSSPFVPALSAAPPDGWEIALNLDPSGANFGSPNGIAIDAVGNAWVANVDPGSVTELNSTGGLVSNFTNSNTAGANFSSPLNIAIDDAGNVWVANAGSSVTELTSDGALVGNFNPGGDTFNTPQDIAIDASGNAWVTDLAVNPAVVELNSSGGLVGSYDPPSGATFDDPYGIAIDGSSNVWVTDYGISAVVKLNSGGGLISNPPYDPSGAFGAPFGIAIDAAGDAWATDYDADEVIELTAAGALGNVSTFSFEYPQGIAIDSSSNVWVTDSSCPALVELSNTAATEGDFNPAGAGLNSPIGIAIDASGNVWIANEFSNSIAEFIGSAGPVLTPLAACLTHTPAGAVCLP